MKKLFLLSVVLLGFAGFAQKTVYFENSSTVTIGIGDIRTVRKVSPRVYGYPAYTNRNTNRGGAYLSIAPGTTYILENVANPGKFPFVSVGNTPQLTSWDRQNSVSSTTPNVPSATAFLTASSQVFTYVKFGKLVGGSITDGTTFSNQSPNEDLSPSGVHVYDGIDYGAFILNDGANFESVFIFFY